jgi:hypothetical protein
MPMAKETVLPSADFKALLSRALIDNTAFAGFMRLYEPEHPPHRDFNERFPWHRQIDERSMADILNAIVHYDLILLERSSEKERRTTEDVQQRKSWVLEMKELLPEGEVRNFFDDFESETRSEFSGSNIEEDMCRCAFHLLASPESRIPRLDPGEHKIPDVYREPDYVYRFRFDELNRDFLLDEERLVQAMFLHRALFLQAVAHEKKAVYMPYYSRGKLLASVPPMTLAHIELDGLVHRSLSNYEGPSPSDVQRRLNKAYYKLLHEATWQRYDVDIPFVGASIWAQASGDPKKAVKMAFDLRDKSNTRGLMVKLQAYAEAGDRPTYEQELKNFRAELQDAAASLNVRIDGSQAEGQQKALQKLCMAFVPEQLRGAVEAIVELAPKSLKNQVRNIGARLVSPSPLQMLFIEHVESLKMPLKQPS